MRAISFVYHLYIIPFICISSGNFIFMSLVFQDCDTLASSGRALESGVYRLKKSRGRSSLAYCHLSNERRGWTLIQRRISGRENFNRTWKEYKRGFGEIGNDSDFWIGLEKIHRWTRNKRCTYDSRLNFGYHQ